MIQVINAAAPLRDESGAREVLRKLAIVALASLVAFTTPALSKPLTMADFEHVYQWDKFISDGAGMIASWAKDDLRYVSAGRKSREADPLIDEIMASISRHTGLKIRRVTEWPADIVFVIDDSAVQYLHDKPELFRRFGLDSSMILSMQKKIPRPSEPGGERCAGHGFSTAANETLVFAISVSQSTSRRCIVMSALAAVGMLLPDQLLESDALLYACILYEGRRVGARTLSDFTSNRDLLETRCQEDFH